MPPPARAMSLVARAIEAHLELAGAISAEHEMVWQSMRPGVMTRPSQSVLAMPARPVGQSFSGPAKAIRPRDDHGAALDQPHASPAMVTRRALRNT